MTSLHGSTRAPLSDEALDQLFRTARTYSAWLDIPITNETLHQIFDLMKWAPTSANLSPARIVFVRSAAAKQRPLPAIAPSNVEKVKTAPATAIFAYDLLFYEKQPKLFPQRPEIREHFGGHVKSNFLCNLGYGDPSQLRPRFPRLSFDEACSIL
jgi:3-hydroxypropanoate dehydrogenase